MGFLKGLPDTVNIVSLTETLAAMGNQTLVDAAVVTGYRCRITDQTKEVVAFMAQHPQGIDEAQLRGLLGNPNAAILVGMIVVNTNDGNKRWKIVRISEKRRKNRAPLFLSMVLKEAD